MSIELNHSKWKMYNFNDIFTEYSKSNTENLEQFTVGKYGLIPKSSEGYSYDVQKHKIFEPNTLLLGIGAEEVGVSTMERGCVSPIYNTFKISDNFDSLFLKYLMPIIISQNKCRISHISTRRNYEIEVSELSKIQIALPPLEIQRKISSLLFDIDNKIENQENLLNKYKDLKSSLLLKLFPIENEDVSKIRFNGFTDTWEQHKLSDIGSFAKGSGYSKSDLKDTGIPLILYGRLYTNYETLIKEINTFADEKQNSVYSKGGEVIIPASGETTEDISIASVVQSPNVLLGGDLNVVQPYDFIDSVFLALSITYSKTHYDLSKLAQGKTVVHIHNPDIKSVSFAFPNKVEQKKISNFFLSIDNLITLHQCKPFYLNFSL